MSRWSSTVLRMTILTGALTIGLAGLLLPVAPEAQELQVDVDRELASIRAMLDRILQDYRDGRMTEAYRASRLVYLDHFELIEIPLRVVDPDLTLEMEYVFANLRTQIRKRASAVEIEKTTRQLREGLTEVEAILQGPGIVAPTLAFTFSFAIIFREGLEAILLLAAILGYLEASRNPAFKRPVYWGTGIAVVATLLTWLLASYVIRISPLGRELLEAITGLVAVAVLFYVSFWLISRLEHRRWMEFIRARVWEAMSTGSMMALTGIGFTVIYREGFETVLFYQALLFLGHGVWAWIVWGFLAGLVVLTILGVAVFRFGLRLPIKVMLGFSVTIMMVLSVTFLGNAFRELQEAGVLQVTSLLGTVPRLPRLVAELTGIHPTLETLGAQALLALVYLAGAVYTFGILPRRYRGQEHAHQEQ
ncbi:MAG: FTR1 family protein [Candidatus Methylomirabilales bacterium]